MEGDKNPEIVPLHTLGPVTRREFEDLRNVLEKTKYELEETRSDLRSYDRRWIDQNKRIHKINEKYHAIRRWQSWVLGASAVGFYVVGFLSKWILEKFGIKTE